MRDLEEPREAEKETKPAQSPGRLLLVPGCFETFPRNAFFPSLMTGSDILSLPGQRGSESGSPRLMLLPAEWPERVTQPL